MSFTPSQFRAIRYYCESAGAVPMLTVYPMVRVQIKATGEVVERHVDELVTEHKLNRAEQTRQRARERREGGKAKHEEYRP